MDCLAGFQAFPEGEYNQVGAVKQADGLRRDFETLDAGGLAVVAAVADIGYQVAVLVDGTEVAMASRDVPPGPLDSGFANSWVPAGSTVTLAVDDFAAATDVAGVAGLFLSGFPPGPAQVILATPLPAGEP